MHKMAYISAIGITLFIGCGKKNEAKPVVPVVEVKATEPTKSETIEFIKEEISKRRVRNFFDNVTIEFDENGRNLKIKAIEGMGTKNFTTIMLKDVKITLGDGFEEIYEAEKAPVKRIAVQTIQFEPNLDGAIYNDLFLYGEGWRKYNQKKFRIHLQVGPENNKIFNAIVHLQKLLLAESKTVSDKF